MFLGSRKVNRSRSTGSKPTYAAAVLMTMLVLYVGYTYQSRYHQLESQLTTIADQLELFKHRQQYISIQNHELCKQLFEHFVVLENLYTVFKGKIYVKNELNEERNQQYTDLVHDLFANADAHTAQLVYNELKHCYSLPFAQLVRKKAMDERYVQIKDVLRRVLESTVDGIPIVVDHQTQCYTVNLPKTIIENNAIHMEKLILCVIPVNRRVSFLYEFSAILCVRLLILDELSPHALCEELVVAYHRWIEDKPIDVQLFKNK